MSLTAADVGCAAVFHSLLCEVIDRSRVEASLQVDQRLVSPSHSVNLGHFSLAEMHSRSRADHSDAAHDRNEGAVYAVHHSHPSTPHISVPLSQNDRSIPQRRSLRLILSIVIIISVVVTTITYFQIQANTKAATKPSSVSLSAHIEQYNRLVVRAQELVRQYKSLSGSNSLPPGLSFQFADPSSSLPAHTSSKTVTTKKIRNKSSKKQGQFGQRTSHPSNPRDLVLGMAHDVDEKNLAVFIKSLRK